MADHIVSTYESELKNLTRSVVEMGGMTEKQVVDAIDALVKRDMLLAQNVIAADPSVDALERVIEERAIITIAKRQPMGPDLREIMSAIRIANDLERIGDLAKNIGKRALALNGAFQAQKLLRGVEHMGELVLGQLKDVLDAFAVRDADKALAVWKSDGEVDQLHTSLFRELLTYMMEDPRTITLCAHLLFIAKNVERIGDHATNIAETVYYLVHGRELTDERPKADASVYVGAANQEPAR